MKKIFTLIAGLFLSASVFSQTMGIVGQFTGWGTSPDIEMTTTDNIQWNASGVVITENGGVKFRLDSQWTTNWGGSTFPSGVAEAGGPDMPGVIGTYDVSFNTNTLEYSFTPVATGFDEVYLVTFGSETPLSTLDGVEYKLENQVYEYEGVTIKRVSNGVTTIYGGTAFPGGSASIGASNIPNTKGYYNLTFNLTTLTYNFEVVPVSIIGDAALGWDTDILMTSTDQGVTSKITQALVVGAIKFRSNNSWATNWGASMDEGTMPDTANVNSFDNFIIAADGNYEISFNRYTRMYCITLVGTGCTIAEGFPAGVGIDENSIIEAVVYPNPTSDVLNFKVNTNIENIIVTDITGKVIVTTNSTKIDVSNIETGNYFYTIVTKEGNASGRFVKN